MIDSQGGGLQIPSGTLQTWINRGRKRKTRLHANQTTFGKLAELYAPSDHMFMSENVHFVFISKDEIQSARKPWLPNSAQPKDLKRSDKLLYSFLVNSNQPTAQNLLDSVYKTQFGLPLASSRPLLQSLPVSKTITGVLCV